MVSQKLSSCENLNKDEVSDLIYNFMKKYNCEVAPKYNLHRKLLTMRDIGWICRFMSECSILGGWEQKYYWSLRILAIEGINFMMADTI